MSKRNPPPAQGTDDPDLRSFFSQADLQALVQDEYRSGDLEEPPIGSRLQSSFRRLRDHYNKLAEDVSSSSNNNGLDTDRRHKDDYYPATAGTIMLKDDKPERRAVYHHPRHPSLLTAARCVRRHRGQAA